MGRFFLVLGGEEIWRLLLMVKMNYYLPELVYPIWLHWEG